jgi:hypothetical protein
MTEEEERVPPSTGAERLEEERVPHVLHALVPCRTDRGSAGDSAEAAEDAADDTIELALTEADMLALSRAAEEEPGDTCPRKSALPATGSSCRELSLRSRTWPPVLAFSLLTIAIGVALGVAVDRISTVTTEVPSVTTGAAESQESPVRFGNPFDASEVFEFPPGTSDDQARQSVAAILLQRAHDREVADAVKSARPTPGAAAGGARTARNSQSRRT